MKFRSLPSLFAAVTALGLCATGTPSHAQEAGTASSLASPAADASPTASPSASPAASPEAVKAADKNANVTPPKDRAVNALILKQYDANHNGLLDPDERKAYENDAPQRKADRLKKYDVNHDGKIDKDERIMVRVDRMRETEAAKKAAAPAATAAPSASPSATPAKKDTAKKP